MKLKIFIYSSLFLLIPFYIQAAEKDSVALSKWSLSVEAGTNAFDGDIKANSHNFFQNVRGGLSLGAVIDYTFNPMVSLGLSYYYHPVSANNEAYIFTSNRHHIAPALSVNLLPIFSKTSKTKWGLWLSGGLGLTYFESDLFYNSASLNAPSKGNRPPSVDLLKSFSLSVPLAVNLEYNFTKNLALGLRIQYSSDNRDDMEGGKLAEQDLNLKGVTNDFLSVGLVNLRWKFAAKKHPHTRNLSWEEYKDIVPDKALEMAKKAREEADQAKQELKDQAEAIADLKKQLQALDPMEKRLKGVEDRLADIEALLSNEGPDTDKDGVPDHRDKEATTPPNTAVDFWGRSLTEKDYASIPTVFFDHDKTALDNAAKESIFIVAQMLKANPNLLVEARGFCDYTGSDIYNQDLSLRRSERVKKELVEVYGIEANRIGVNGKGRIIEPSTSYRPNRRVEFHFNE